MIPDTFRVAVAGFSTIIRVLTLETLLTRRSKSLGTIAIMLVASTPAPVDAEVCADFRAAVAIDKAAMDAAFSFLDSTRAPDILDQSPEALTHRATREALFRAMDDAGKTLEKAAQTVRESIKDTAASSALDAIAAIDDAHTIARGALHKWHTPSLPLAPFHPIYDAINSIASFATDAYHEALQAACNLGLAGGD